MNSATCFRLNNTEAISHVYSCSSHGRGGHGSAAYHLNNIYPSIIPRLLATASVAAVTLSMVVTVAMVVLLMFYAKVTPQ